MILGYGLALHNQRASGNGAVNDYITRVTDDGGTVENIACLNAKVSALDFIATPYWELVEDFETRVIGDSGTFEGFFCVRTKLINTF